MELLKIETKIHLNSKEAGPLTINESLANSNKEFIFNFGRNSHSEYLHPPKSRKA